MNSRHLILTGLVLMLVAITLTEAKRGGKHRSTKNNETNHTECLGERLEMSKFMVGFDECADSMIPSSDFPLGSNDDQKINHLKARKKAVKKNHWCIQLCQRKKIGILDDSGSYSEGGVEKIVNEIFPEKARSRMTRGIERCSEDLGKVEASENCRGFKRFEKCLMRITSKACGWKDKKGRGGNRRSNKGKNKANRRQGGGGNNKDLHHDEDEHEEEEIDTEDF